MNRPPRVVAAFDFDGTLSRRDTLVPFLVEVAGAAKVAGAAAVDAPRLARMAIGRADRDAAKADFVARVLTGMAYGDVASAGRLYAERVAESKLRGSTLNRLRWHQHEGHDVVIISASLDTYLHEVVWLLGVGSVLCTTLEVDDRGIITGRLVGGNCRGPEKVNRLAAHLNATATTTDAPTLVWAYGDSSGDDELLAVADRATRVARNGRLIEATQAP